MCVMCVNIFTNEWRERARERPMHQDRIGRLRVLRKRRCHRLFLSTLSSGNCESAEISHHFSRAHRVKPRYLVRKTLLYACVQKYREKFAGHLQTFELRELAQNSPPILPAHMHELE